MCIAPRSKGKGYKDVQFLPSSTVDRKGANMCIKIINQLLQGK